MAYIRVDHSRLEATASAVDTYVTFLNNKMKSAKNEVDALAVSWHGEDYRQFNLQFDQIDNSGSAHYQMVHSLESYSEYLRYAASAYKDTQARAINRANGLPRW